MADRKLIPMTKAAERLGISRVTLRKLVKEGRFTVYDDPLDKRVRLLDEGEVEEASQPKPRLLRSEEDEPKKAAA